MVVNKPKKLARGSTIALIAPSSYCAPEDSAGAKAELEKLGYHVYVHPQCLVRDHMSAGTPQQKVDALHDVFADPKIDAVFCLRGGYQTLHMLDKIDYDVIRNNPKILMGYSDITALHGAFLQRSGLTTFHGPNGNGFKELSNAENTVENENALRALDFLNGNVPQNLLHNHPVRVLQNGDAIGTILCGNLQLLSSLIEAGPNYCPPLENTILMIEDISEEITKVDRQFGAWRLRGIFKNIAGLVIGHMTDIKDTPGRAGTFGYDLETVIRRHTTEVKGPILMAGPFGHVQPNFVFPQGIKAQLSVKSDVSVLSLLESPFSDA